MKKLLIIFLLSILAIILHNAFYAIFKIEEPVFFLLGIGGLVIFAVLAAYNAIKLLISLL